MKLDEPNIDNLLHAALQHYGEVEPRAGLEKRILARLHAVEPAPRRAWWWPLVAGAATAFVFFVSYLRFATNEPIFLSLARATPSPPSIALVRANALKRHGSDRVVSSSRRSSTQEQPQVAAVPKADQFPSPLPLSEQEQMLARYVAKHRDRAVLMARAQTELIRVQQEDDSKESGPYEQDPPHTRQ